MTNQERKQLTDNIFIILLLGLLVSGILISFNKDHKA